MRRRAVILLRRVLPSAPRLTVPRSVKPYQALYEVGKEKEREGYFKSSVEKYRRGSCGDGNTERVNYFANSNVQYGKSDSNSSGGAERVRNNYGDTNQNVEFNKGEVDRVRPNYFSNSKVQNRKTDCNNNSGASYYDTQNTKAFYSDGRSPNYTQHKSESTNVNTHKLVQSHVNSPKTSDYNLSYRASSLSNKHTHDSNADSYSNSHSNQKPNTSAHSTNNASITPHSSLQGSFRQHVERPSSPRANENVFKSVEQNLFENIYRRNSQNRVQNTSQHNTDRKPIHTNTRVPLYLRRATQQNSHVENPGRYSQMSNLNKIINADVYRESDRNDAHGFIRQKVKPVNHCQAFESFDHVPLYLRKSPPNNNSQSKSSELGKSLKAQKTNGLNLNYKLSDLNINISLFDFMKDIHFSTQL